MILVFFKDIMDKLLEAGDLENVFSLKTVTGSRPVYVMKTRDGRRVVVIMPGIGAPYSAAMLEELIALGIRKVVVVGTCGVLRKDIAKGHLVIPSAAIRDEGTSYHYIPPGREVRVPDEIIKTIEETLKEQNVPYVKGKTWTTG